MTYPIEKLPALAVAENLPTYMLDDTLTLLTAEKAATDSPEDFVASSYRLGCTYVDRGLASASADEAEAYFDSAKEQFTAAQEAQSSLAFMDMHSAIMEHQLPLMRMRKQGTQPSEAMRAEVEDKIAATWTRTYDELSGHMAPAQRSVIAAQKASYLLIAGLYEDLPAYVAGPRESREGFKFRKRDEDDWVTLSANEILHNHSVYLATDGIKVPFQMRKKTHQSCRQVLSIAMKELFTQHHRDNEHWQGKLPAPSKLFKHTLSWLDREQTDGCLPERQQIIIDSIRDSLAMSVDTYISGRHQADPTYMCDHVSQPESPIAVFTHKRVERRSLFNRHL